jgi:hypothetical protein
MPRKKIAVPSYLPHKARNCGKVRIDGRDHYLPGEFDSPESLEAYRRFVAEYLAAVYSDDYFSGLTTIRIPG